MGCRCVFALCLASNWSAACGSVPDCDGRFCSSLDSDQSNALHMFQKRAWSTAHASSEVINEPPNRKFIEETGVDSKTAALDDAKSDVNPGSSAADADDAKLHGHPSPLSPAILAAIRLQVKEEFDCHIITLKERIAVLEEKLQGQHRPAREVDENPQLFQTNSSHLGRSTLGFWSKVKNKVKREARNIANEVVEGVVQPVDDLVKKLDGVVKKIKRAVKKGFNWMKDLYKDKIEPIVKHVGKCAKSAKNPGTFIECLTRPVVEKLFAAIFPEVSVQEAVGFPFDGQGMVYDPVIDGYIEVAPDADIAQDDLRDYAGQSCGNVEKEMGVMTVAFHACNLPFGLTPGGETSAGNLAAEIQTAARECAMSRSLYDAGGGEPSVFAGIADLSQRSHRELTDATRIAAYVASGARSAFLNEDSSPPPISSRQAVERAQKSCHAANAASLLTIRAVAGQAQDRVVSDFEDLYMKAVDCFSKLGEAQKAFAGLSGNWQEAAANLTGAQSLIGRLRYDMQSLYREGDLEEEVQRIFKKPSQPRNVYDLAELAENCVIGAAGYMKAYLSIKVFDYEVMRVSMHERDGFKYAYLDFQLDGTTVKHDHFTWKQLSQQKGANIEFCRFLYCVKLRLKLSKGLNNLFGVPVPGMDKLLSFGSVDFIDMSIESIKITLKKIGIPVQYSLPVGTGFPLSTITIPFVVNPTPKQLYTFSKRPVDQCLVDLNVEAGKLTEMSATAKRDTLILKLKELGEAHPSFCPASHPYPYHKNDAWCCATNREGYWGPSGKKCDGSVFHAGAVRSMCCENSNSVRCASPPCSKYQAYPSMCPASYPYAYHNNNAWCCATNKEKHYIPFGAACDGSEMGAGGVHSMCCENNENVRCPSPPCSNYKAPSICPASYPYAYHTDNAWCCATNKEKYYTPSGAACDGSEFEAGGVHSMCCANDDSVRCPSPPCSNYKATEDEFALTQCRVAKNGNYYRRDGGGNSGAICTCPDGQAFEVADHGDACRACEGGVCKRSDISEKSYGMRVTCERAIDVSKQFGKCLVFLKVWSTKSLRSKSLEDKRSTIIFHFANKTNLSLPLLQSKSNKELATMCDMAYTHSNGYQAVAANEEKYEQSASPELKAIMAEVPQIRTEEECSLASSKEACTKGCQWREQLCEPDLSDAAMNPGDQMVDIKTGDVIILYNVDHKAYLGSCSGSGGTANPCTGGEYKVYGYRTTQASIKWKIEIAGTIAYLKSVRFAKYLGMCGETCKDCKGASHNVNLFDSKSDATQFRIRAEGDHVYLFVEGYGYIGMSGGASCNGLFAFNTYGFSKVQPRTKFMIQKDGGLLKAAPPGSCKLKMGSGTFASARAGSCLKMGGLVDGNPASNPDRLTNCRMDWCTDGIYAASPQGTCKSSPVGYGEIILSAKDCRNMGGKYSGNPPDNQVTSCYFDWCKDGMYAAGSATRADKVGYGITIMLAGECRAIGGAIQGNPQNHEKAGCHLSWVKLPAHMHDFPDDVVQV